MPMRRGTARGSMSKKRRERRDLSYKEWRNVTSKKPPVVKRYRAPDRAANSFVRKLTRTREANEIGVS